MSVTKAMQNYLRVTISSPVKLRDIDYKLRIDGTQPRHNYRLRDSLGFNDWRYYWAA